MATIRDGTALCFRRPLRGTALLAATLTAASGCGDGESSAGGGAAGSGPDACATSDPTEPTATIERATSDGAQRMTLGFSGFAMLTGNLEAQSFFPPGKVADYTGFQFLRDNDPDGMGHNTSFLSRIAYNVLSLLDDAQLSQLTDLAVAERATVEAYGYGRFTLMQAFRRLLEGDVPAGSSGLDVDAVRQASRDLYLLDGALAFDRARLYASVLASFGAEQFAYLDAMVGRGFECWPDVSRDEVEDKLAGLPSGSAQAVMTYAGDLFSWYAGSIDADVYFCPERHGTYFGSFYVKDAPAVGHEGYGIDPELTADAGACLVDASKGYVTEEQAAAVSSLVDVQRANLHGSATESIVRARTEIAGLLRELLSPGVDPEPLRTAVLDWSALYGELDGENNYQYATTFALVRQSLTAEQETALGELRGSILAGTYADGTAFDFTVCTTPYLYATPIDDPSVLEPYLSASDALFAPP